MKVDEAVLSREVCYTLFCSAVPVAVHVVLMKERVTVRLFATAVMCVAVEARASLLTCMILHFG